MALHTMSEFRIRIIKYTLSGRCFKSVVLDNGVPQFTAVPQPFFAVEAHFPGNCMECCSSRSNSPCKRGNFLKRNILLSIFQLYLVKKSVHLFWSLLFAFNFFLAAYVSYHGTGIFAIPI